MFARQSGLECTEMELVVDNRVARVATETGGRVCVAERASNGLINVLWSQVLIAHGDVEAIHRRIIADQALVHATVALQNPGLRLCAHRPQDRQRDGLSAIAHDVLALAVACFHGCLLYTSRCV